MTRDFQQIDWNQQVEQDCRALVGLAIREDLAGEQDWTTQALVPADVKGHADIVSRQAGIVAGIPALVAALDEMQARVTLTPAVREGQAIASDTVVASLSGYVQDLLTSERILLNLLGRLMGIATLAHQYVEAVAGTNARVYDTRKTTPGWRRLEKYAVRCGGACNHRTGLFDAVLIKDNHLAQLGLSQLGLSELGFSELGLSELGLSELGLSDLNTHGPDANGPDALSNNPAAAVQRAREFLVADSSAQRPNGCLIEVEVDTIAQLTAVLSARPDIVLLDNMSVDVLREAVDLRNSLAPQVQLEASGGISLQRIHEVAATGVERISVGALTHSASSLDVGLDWR
jgi:nicotinate-nucleotide pyrophosphorylase (carboxylating)